MSDNSTHDRELEVTWRRGLSVWWLIEWRTVLITSLALASVYFACGFIVGSTGRAIQSARNCLPPPLVSIVVYAIAVVVVLFVVRMALRKNYRGWRIALIPIAAPSNETPETTDTKFEDWVQIISIWWLIIWRNIALLLSIILIIVVSMIIIVFFIALFGPATDSQHFKLLGYKIGYYFGLNYIFWIFFGLSIATIFAVRMALRKKYRSFQLVLISADANLTHSGKNS